MIDESLLQPVDDFQAAFPELGFARSDVIDIVDGELLITDPNNLGDVFNCNSDPVAPYVRSHGAVVGDFGGDTSCMIWRFGVQILLPLAMFPPYDPAQIPGAVPLGEVGCDSGTFVFLPLDDGAPELVKTAIQETLAAGNGVCIHLPKGRYRLSYQQFETPEGLLPSFARDIVLRPDA